MYRVTKTWVGKHFYRRLIIPVFFDILLATSWMWLFQDKLPSIFIQRNLVLVTLCRSVPFEIETHIGHTLSWTKYHIICLHSILATSNVLIFTISVLRLRIAVSTFLWLYTRLVSSAKKPKWHNFGCVTDIININNKKKRTQNRTLRYSTKK